MNDLEKVMKWALAVALGALLMSVLARPAFAAGSKRPAPVDAGVPAQVVELAVTEKGFEPDSVKVKKDVPLELHVTRKTEETCATTLVVPDYGVKQKLPLNEMVKVSFTPTKAGSLRYGCAMGMMVHAVLLVE